MSHSYEITLRAGVPTLKIDEICRSLHDDLITVKAKSGDSTGNVVFENTKTAPQISAIQAEYDSLVVVDIELDSAKKKKKKEISMYAESLEHAAIVEHNGANYQINHKSQSRINGAITIGNAHEAINGAGSFAIDWIDADNNHVPGLTLADLNSIALATGPIISVIAHNTRSHKDAVDALTDIDDINDYDYSTGWS